MDPSARRTTALVLAACALLTVLGFLLKAQCIGHYSERRDARLCSNDIQVLYSSRGLADGQVPYLHGGLVDGRLTGGTVEYPVLTGLAAWLPSLVVRDEGTYLVATAVLLAPFSLLTAWLLVRMTGRRALVYGLGPPLVWYSFHNWDLLVVAAAVAAVHAWRSGRFRQCGVLLAVGASLKLWPGFFLLPLVLDRLRAGDRKGALTAGGAAAAAYAAINGPFLLANPAGWWAPYAFQGLRAADVTSNSIWYWGFAQLTTGQLNLLIPALLMLAFAGALGYGWYAAGRAGAFPFVQVCAAMLAAFMLLNKAHSPQFALWILPFFVLLRLRWGWVAAYLALDSTLYVGLFRWFFDLSRGTDFGLAKQAVILGVWGRAVCLTLLYVAFLRAPSAGRESPSCEPTGAALPLSA